MGIKSDLQATKGRSMEVSASEFGTKAFSHHHRAICWNAKKTSVWQVLIVLAITITLPIEESKEGTTGDSLVTLVAYGRESKAVRHRCKRTLF